MAHNGRLNRLWEPLLFFLSPFMHPLPVRAQRSECCSPSVQRSIWHFALPLHYFNIQSPPHNPITVKSLLCAHQCLVFSFFSLTMSCQWNETEYWWKQEERRRNTLDKRWNTEKERVGQSRRESKKKGELRHEVWFDLKGSMRDIKAGRRIRNSKKWEDRCF